MPDKVPKLLRGLHFVGALIYFSFLSGFAAINVERFQAGVGVHPVSRRRQTAAAR